MPSYHSKYQDRTGSSDCPSIDTKDLLQEIVDRAPCIYACMHEGHWLIVRLIITTVTDRHVKSLIAYIYLAAN